MASDIKELANMWSLPGNEATESARTKPLQQHSDGAEPWQKIGLDFFEIAGKHYLIADLITTMTSARTVTSLKNNCARYDKNQYVEKSA